ncbi:MAG: VTT domain-containing protein [Candidatus Anstonellaceae archaeon]
MLSVQFGKKEIASLLAALLIAFAAVVAFKHLPQLRHIGYLEIFVASFLSSATILLPLPGFALVFAAASYLNPLLLGLAAGVGSGLGEISGFMAGLAGHSTVKQTKFFKLHQSQIRKYGSAAVFVLAVIPNPVFDVVGMAAGALKMEWWKFLVAAIAGKSLRYMVLAFLGEFSSAWV